MLLISNIVYFHTQVRLINLSSRICNVHHFIIIPAKAREYVFTGVGLCVCVGVCLCVCL